MSTAMTEGSALRRHRAAISIFVALACLLVAQVVTLHDGPIGNGNSSGAAHLRSHQLEPAATTDVQARHHQRAQIQAVPVTPIPTAPAPTQQPGLPAASSVPVAPSAGTAPGVAAAASAPRAASAPKAPAASVATHRATHRHVRPVAPPAIHHHLPARYRALVPSDTEVATMYRNVAGYATAHAHRRSMIVPDSWYGRTSVLPVIAQTRTRLDVRLARRPNESTTWINRSEVNLSSTNAAILVDIAARRLYLFRGGRFKKAFPVGVGRPQTPTPTGIYFLAFHAPPNGPEYGPVMLETSAHSNVYKTFDGGSDAIIAIHGPIGADAEIGTHGAAISNGCIRMHDADLVQIAGVPDGTPIILAG